MAALVERWNGFIDWCRAPAVPFQKFGDSGDIESSNKRLYAALAAEFIGMALFALYGGEAHDSAAAYGNGLTLAVLVYATANISGGHLNPAVTLGTIISGHMAWRRGLLYMAAQFLGGIMGVLFQVGLIPTAHFNMGNEGPGCFTHLGGTFLRVDQLFGWELLMTFLLVSVVFAVAVSKPGHGNIGPLAVGYTLFASAFIAGPLTGAALNPARVFGPALVYNCFWNTVFVYIFAQYLGGALAAILALVIYGPGPEHDGGHESDPLALQMAGTSLPHGSAGGSPAKKQPGAGQGQGERAGLINVAANGSSSGAQWSARFG